MNKGTRTESDSMGEIEVPSDALYGAQTQRAVENFTISSMTMPAAFIRALLQVKQAAAAVNGHLGQLPEDIAGAICDASRELVSGNAYMQHFPLDVFQTGSGTSTNMNANEVLARLASQRLGKPVSANDHVNCGQSSNDVIPTAISVSACLVLNEQLLPALRYLQDVIEKKSADVDGHIKTGRTHLMDAMPVNMSQAVGAWASQVESCIHHLESSMLSLSELAQGGTAVGTGVNCHPGFAELFCIELNRITGQRFVPAKDFFFKLSCQDAAVSLSGHLKTAAVALMKIANDLRWMNSGPLAGLGEIELEALQPGSSIMPGKVNPVIPEAVAMVSAQVIGNDTTITVAGQSGNFELNVMLPVIAHNLLESLAILSSASRLLADKAIRGFSVKEDNLKRALAMNPILATALNPVIGYMKAAEVAKRAYRQGRPIIDVAVEMTDLSRGELEQLLNPETLTHPEAH